VRTAAARPMEACLLFQHLGIQRAHIAAGGPPPVKDWHSLGALHPERVGYSAMDGALSGRTTNPFSMSAVWACMRMTLSVVGWYVVTPPQPSAFSSWISWMPEAFSSISTRSAP
jgi:hypothetical protein